MNIICISIPLSEQEYFLLKKSAMESSKRHREYARDVLLRGIGANSDDDVKIKESESRQALTSVTANTLPRNLSTQAL